MSGLVLIAILTMASPDEPRFVMSSEIGDTMKAELYSLTAGDPVPQARNLLGDIGTAGDIVSRTTDGVVVMYREGSLPVGPLVVYADSTGSGQRDSLCRLTRDPDGTNDTAERAMRWCLTFITDMRPTVVVPPALPQPQ